MITKDIAIYRGDDYTLEVALLDSDGMPADLKSAEVKLAFCDSMGDDLRYAGIIINDNTVSATFSHALTKDIEWSTGKYDLQVTMADGRVSTPVKGKIKMIQDVTP